MGLTLFHNLGEVAQEWIQSANYAYNSRNGDSLLNHWDTLKEIFLARFGKSDPAESTVKIGQVQQGKDEAVGTLPQRLRDLFVQADINHEQVKIHHFKMSLRSPLRKQLHTRGASTFDDAVDIAEELDRGLWAMEKAPTAKPTAPLQVTARATNQVRIAEADRYSEADSEHPQDEDFDTARLTQQDQPRPPAAGRYPERNTGARNERPQQQGRSSFPPKPRACFNCGKTGHVQMHCPEPQKNTARWANEEEVDYGYADCDTETVYEDCEPPTIMHSTFEGEWVPDTPAPRQASGIVPSAPLKARVCHSCGKKGA